MRLSRFCVATFVILFYLLTFIACKNEEVINVEKEEVAIQTDGVINDEVNGIPIVIYGNSNKSFFTAFRSIDVSGKRHEFIRSEKNFPDVFEDEDGNIWDVHGVQKAGADTKLLKASSLVGYWFSFPSFFENIKIYNGPGMSNTVDEFDSKDWLINKNYIFAGSVKGGIQALNQPAFINIKDKAFLQHDFYNELPKSELISVVANGDVKHAYPHRILEYHEVVNDVIDGTAVTFSFCPLTGTSRAWESEMEGKTFHFGVSGLLYNNNLILYDLLTDSNWSQILNKSVNGILAGMAINEIQVLELKMEDLPSLGGRVEVLSPATGLGYDYQYSIYKQYSQSENINFPVMSDYGNIPAKEKVLGIAIGDSTKVYRFQNF